MSEFTNEKKQNECPKSPKYWCNQFKKIAIFILKWEVNEARFKRHVHEKKKTKIKLNQFHLNHQKCAANSRQTPNKVNYNGKRKEIVNVTNQPDKRRKIKQIVI